MIQSLSFSEKELEEILTDTPLCKLKRAGFFSNKIVKQPNELIRGDCLTVMKTLCDSFDLKGKIDLVYIDPPFATGREWKINQGETTKQFSKQGEEAYNDTLLDEEYLDFLKKRLVFLRELLSDKGSIYIHIDYKIGHYVKILMDEVFGRKRFINDITRIKCNPKNFKRRAYGNVKDMILFYSKTSEYTWNEPREEFSEEDIERLFPKIDSRGRKYTTHPLHAPGETENGRTGTEWKGMKPPKGRHWRYDPKVLTELDKKGLIEWSPRGNPRKIVYADKVIGNGKKMQDIWEFKDPQYPKYPTEKNLKMLEKIIKASSNKGDLVLDAFCGSGTTLLAAEKWGRNWIGIDNSQSAINVSMNRLKKTNSCFELYNAISNS